jgi:hypothetical protein
MVVGLIVACIFLLLLYVAFGKEMRECFTKKKVCNSLDQRCYPIASKYDPSTVDDASARLAKLNKFSIEFMRRLREKYVFNSHPDEYRVKAVRYLLHNYDPTALTENVPVSKDTTSYVENKGEVFAVCLREKLTGRNQFHDLHTLQFVMLHEMSHLASYGFGHGPEFWMNFKIMLQEAKEFGLHEPIDYSKRPVHYCSITIDYNPYFDASIPVR